MTESGLIDRPQNGLDIVNYARLDALIAGGLPREYAAAKPFPHMMIDDFLDEAIARKAASEISDTQVPVDPNFYGSFEKFKLSNSEQFGPAVAEISRELNSAAFLRRVEMITGIAQLRADSTLEGGGIHRIGTGGYLKIHTDFNFHRLSGEHRRLNLLVYLNPQWNDEWGGNLELWETDMSRVSAAYAPKFNRAVLFTTTDDSYHGHPDPLKTPKGIYRQSLAYYYYTERPPEGRSKFGHSEMTNYRPRPGESFGMRHAVHQFMIKHPRIRPLIDAIKGALRKH